MLVLKTKDCNKEQKHFLVAIAKNIFGSGIFKCVSHVTVDHQFLTDGLVYYRYILW